MAVVRRRIVFHGRVQGVGFRATTLSIAARHPVAGYVRNLPDGTVELVAEGEEGAIDALVADVRDRFGRGVTQVDSSPAGRDEPLSGFTIRR